MVTVSYLCGCFLFRVSCFVFHTGLPVRTTTGTMKPPTRTRTPLNASIASTTMATATATTKTPFKCQSLYLAILGVLIVGVEVLTFFRQLGAPSHLQVDLGDWNPESVLQEEATSTSNFNFSASSSHTRPHHSHHQVPPKPDGTFNGYPIYFQSASHPILSEIHCIGETNADPFFWRRKRKHFDMNWATRSCRFSFLCLDWTTHEFVLRLPRDHVVFPSHIESQQTVFTNQSAQGHPFGVSIGGINTKWTHAAYPKLHWFPRIDYYDPKDETEKGASFYALPANVTLIPFHSLAAFNPGHLVWDDFLPLYTLMQIFHLDSSSNHENDNENENDKDKNESSFDALFIRYQLPGDGLWAGCDWTELRSKDCEFMLNKFGPLMVRNPKVLPITTQHNLNLTLNEKDASPKSNLVCARQGLAGLGALTDHGTDKGHGWEQRDYQTMYNQGRGGQLWRFRNFMLRHLQLPITTAPPVGPPYRIIFSERSSAMPHRSISFGPFVEALQNAADFKDVIEPLQVRMKDYSLVEQAQLVGQAAIYVTGSGGGAVTATFLPRGASLLVFYSEVGGVENNKGSGKPARLDWDYFNNMGYVKTHWLPQPRWYGKIPTEEEKQIFVELIRHDLNQLQERQSQEQQ